MSVTVESEFKVNDIVERQGDIWLEDRHPDRSGLLVAVELDVDYDDDLWETLGELRTGDVIEATLKSQNSQDTVWHFDGVDVKRRTRSLGSDRTRSLRGFRGSRRRDRSRSR